MTVHITGCSTNKYDKIFKLVYKEKRKKKGKSA